MIYSIIVLTTGIYIGQEYDIIPSIRLLCLNVLSYLRNLQEINNPPIQQNNIPTWIIQSIQRYFIRQ